MDDKPDTAGERGIGAIERNQLRMSHRDEMRQHCNTGTGSSEGRLKPDVVGENAGLTNEQVIEDLLLGRGGKRSCRAYGPPLGLVVSPQIGFRCIGTQAHLAQF